MIVPDLQALLAYWVPLLKLQAHDITMQYVPDLRAPASQEELEAFLTGRMTVDGFTGSAVWGLNIGSPDSRRARIFVRMPKTEAEAAEVPETAVHELLHCVTAAAEAPAVIDEQIVWTLAPLLTQLQQQEPQRARVLARAMGRQEKTLLVQGARAAQGKPMADEKKPPGKPAPNDKKPAPKPAEGALAKARALVQQVRHMLDPKVIEEVIAAIAEGNGEKAIELLKAILTAAATGYEEPAQPPEGEPGMAQDPPMPPDPEKPSPTMGDKPEDEKYRVLAKAQADDRAAAVDGLLDTRPDLSTKQRARLRELGIAAGVANVREDLAELVPPPKPAEPGADTARARMGVDKPPTGGKGKAFRPSGNADSMIRLRLSAEDGAELSPPGAKIHDTKEMEETGHLFEISIWKGLPAIRKAVAANTQARAKRLMMAGGDS